MQNKRFFGDILALFCFVNFNDLGYSINCGKKYAQISNKFPLKHLIKNIGFIFYIFNSI